MIRTLSATISLCFLFLLTDAQILDNYLPLTMGVGRDTSIFPATAPVNTSKISVIASGNFSGILTGDASSGKVSITDAKPVGAYTISVMAFSSGGSTAIKTFTLIVNNTECSDGRFNGNTNYPILRPNLTGLAIGDFNGDNKQDLLAAHLGYNSVSIRFGNGSGGFTGNTEEPASSHPDALAVGDFNRDGKQDFLVSCEGADLIAVRLGDGTGIFSSMPNVPVEDAPSIIAVTDFNADGKLDFAVANFHSNSVSVRLGDGSGNFTGNTNVAVGLYPECVAIGDFNNDFKQDFVVTNSGGQNVSIRLGNGLGNFVAAPDVTVGFNPYSVVVGDFNLDGNQDIAVANYASNSISVRLGNGSGGFSGNTEIAVAAGPYSLALGNFNGDTYLDLAVTNYFVNKVSILLGDGVGGFYGNLQVAVGSYPVFVVVGDFNADKRQDLAIANYSDHSISVRLGMVGLPTVSPVASNSPICVGATIQLFASGANTYSWSGPNGFSSNDQTPVIPNASSSNMGIYSLSISDLNNCSATLSTLVRVNPPPVVTVTLTQDSLCTFDPAILLGGGMPPGGVFSGPGVSPGNTFDPSLTGPGNFYLYYNYTDTNDCSASNFDKMTVLICNEIAEIKNDSGFDVFPNPVVDNFSVHLNSKSTGVKLELFSQDGKLIREWKDMLLTYSSYSIKDLPGGMYILKCISDQGIFMHSMYKLN